MKYEDILKASQEIAQAAEAKRILDAIVDGKIEGDGHSFRSKHKDADVRDHHNDLINNLLKEYLEKYK